MNADGTGQTRLTDNAADDIQPDWGTAADEESEEPPVEEEEDIIPPIVVSTFPEDDALDVPIDIAAINATFSEAVVGVDEDSFIVINSEGSTVQGEVTYDSVTNTTTFTPDSALEYDTEYTASLSSAIEDLAGNALEETEWSFTTIAAQDTTSPTVISTNRG